MIEVRVPALGASPAETRELVPTARKMELIDEWTGAEVKQHGQQPNSTGSPNLSDFAEGCGTNLNGVALLVLTGTRNPVLPGIQRCAVWVTSGFQRS
jgi:hypothetical protein